MANKDNKEDKKAPLIVMVSAIVSITVIETAAVLNGLNGIFMSLSVGGVVFIARGELPKIWRFF